MLIVHDNDNKDVVKLMNQYDKHIVYTKEILKLQEYMIQIYRK